MKNILQFIVAILGIQTVSTSDIYYHNHHYDNKKVFVNGVDIISSPKLLSKTDFIKYMLIKKNVICL